MTITNAIEHTLAFLRKKPSLTVTEANIMRDCEIALGQTEAKPETVAEARARVVKALQPGGEL